MKCQICYDGGMVPRCPFCGRKYKKAKTPHEKRVEKIRKDALRERIKLNEQAKENFKKSCSKGSGCESFDNDVRNTAGDWET